MPNIAETQEGARKVLPIIYVLDVSGSMQGQPIGSLNTAMRETMPILREIEKTNVGAHVKVGAVTFGSQVSWISHGLEDIDDFIWNDAKATGLTELGEVLKELNLKMSRSEMFQSEVGFKLPVLIFLSDGAPTDKYSSWEAELDKITSENKWFKESTKIAIALGDYADKAVLTKIVDGHPEAVIEMDSLEKLEKLISVISATASKIGSVSKLTGGNMAKQIADSVKKQMDIDDNQDSSNITQASYTTDVSSPDTETSFDDDDDDDDWNK